MFDKRFPVVRCAAVSSVQVTDKGDGAAGEWAECSVTRVCLHGTSRTAPVIVLDPFAVTFSWSTFNTFRGRLIVLAVAVDTYKRIVGVLSKVHCNLWTYLHLFDCFHSIVPQTDSFTAMV